MGESIMLRIGGDPQHTPRGRARIFHRKGCTWFKTRKLGLYAKCNMGCKPGVSMPPEYNRWKKAARTLIASEIQEQGLPWDGPVQVVIIAVYALPKTHHRKTDDARRPRQWHQKKPDTENLAKAYLDAMSGVVYGDDAQVSRLVVDQVVGHQEDEPSVTIVVERLDPDAPLLLEGLLIR